MKNILLTGMSGTGKSTVIHTLAAQGYKAIDADYEGFSKWVPVTDDADIAGQPVEANRDWVWDEDRMEALLSAEGPDLLFIGGCSPNMGKFMHYFDHVILLSAPTAVISERLLARTNNPYGKTADELTRVLELVETVEPLLRKAADYEINTNTELEKVIAQVLQIALS